ncbi:hypothetical protein ECANGB1_2419 [Enterospora canceri]|uniref:Uncharacterized protein n=1 Tax=Enterospora canceri TaxID=1081671 RepID=A0A1Y1S4Q5_9MICR|nr:hypothetical protein ECANGB1_2419 [Enterospora canceri]
MILTHILQIFAWRLIKTVFDAFVKNCILHYIIVIIKNFNMKSIIDVVFQEYTQTRSYTKLNLTISVYNYSEKFHPKTYSKQLATNIIVST